MNDVQLTTVEQVAGLIQRLNAKEISQVITLVKDRRSSLAREVASTFSPGDRVEFKGPGKILVQGEVVRRLKKNILVTTEGGDWRVHPTLLNPV